MDLIKYTPIRDRLTNEPISIGDYVKNERSQCGILSWDDYYNRYVIRTKGGGNVYANFFYKIEELFKNEIDTTKVECRRKK